MKALDVAYLSDKKARETNVSRAFPIGGDGGTRTPDPLHAKDENGLARPEILVVIGLCP